MLCKVSHCAGRVLANTRPHQLCWGDQMDMVVVVCISQSLAFTIQIAMSMQWFFVRQETLLMKVI